jgi:hypothetical protein
MAGIKVLLVDLTESPVVGHIAIDEHLGNMLDVSRTMRRRTAVYDLRVPK